MDLSTRLGVTYIVKHLYAIRLKFGDKLSTPVTKLVLEVKASVCSTMYFYIDRL